MVCDCKGNKWVKRTHVEQAKIYLLRRERAREREKCRDELHSISSMLEWWKYTLKQTSIVCCPHFHDHAPAHERTRASERSVLLGTLKMILHKNSNSVRHTSEHTHTHTHPISKISAVAFWSMRFICQYKRWKGTTTRSKINNNKMKTIKEKREECQRKMAERQKERERARGDAERKIERRALYTNYANSSVKKNEILYTFPRLFYKAAMGRLCCEWANERLCKKKKSAGLIYSKRLNKHDEQRKCIFLCRCGKADEGKNSIL